MDQDTRWESHPEGRVKFQVPADWTTTQIDDKAMKLIGPEGVSIEFHYFNQGAEAIQDEKLIIEKLHALVSNPKITNPGTTFEQHGLTGFGIGGVGDHDGQPIAWFSITVGDKHGHGVLTCGLGNVPNFKNQYKTIVEIMGSIQPIG
jgi:hypothetical protein